MARGILVTGCPESALSKESMLLRAHRGTSGALLPAAVPVVDPVERLDLARGFGVEVFIALSVTESASTSKFPMVDDQGLTPDLLRASVVQKEKGGALSTIPGDEP